MQPLLIIEPIASLAELEAEADSRDLQAIEGFTSAGRRAERLSWRRVLRRVAPDAVVEYESSGAPLLKNSPFAHSLFSLNAVYASEKMLNAKGDLC